MISIADQLGRIIQLPAYPKRIVSLVPSQTELLFDLGLREEVVGITKFCVHPRQWFDSKTRVGGTKTIKMAVIHSLQPNLVIANKEENTKEQIDQLAEQYPVFISDVKDLPTALQMIISVGDITNTSSHANAIARQVQDDFNNLAKQWKILAEGRSQIRSAYLIWNKPYMAAGGDTFIGAMLRACGLKNMFEHLSRYPTITIEDLQTSRCELLLLSSEPYPFSRKHVEELQISLPATEIVLVDGQMFSWYGSRLLRSVAYFRNLRFKI
jgi:ABC-type Fe3+-hydroxamate transport system substrate-binding protein